MADETTAPAPGTSDPQSAGTKTPADPGAAGKDAEGEVKLSAHEYGILRDARAREKALADEVERLKGESVARATTTTDMRAPDISEMSDGEIAALKGELSTSYKAGNKDAGAVLAAIVRGEQAISSARRLAYDSEMAQVPEDRREAVKKHMKESGAPTPLISYRLLRGGEADAKDKRIAQLEQELSEAKKPKPKIEGTRIAGLPAGEEPEDGFITLTDYNERMRKDPHKTIADRKAGKFKVRMA